MTAGDRQDGALSGTPEGAPIALFVSHPLGGIDYFVADLGAELRLRGNNIRLVALYPVEGAQTGVWEYIAQSRPTKLVEKVLLLGRLILWVQRIRPSAVMTTMPAVSASVPVICRIFSRETKVVIAHHSPTEVYSRTADLLDTLVGQIDSVSSVVCVSRSVAETLTRKPSRYRSKICVVPNALPASVQRSLSDIGIPDQRKPAYNRVVAAGRLAPEKNLQLLLRAAALLPDLHVDLIGSGPEEVPLVRLAKDLGISSRVHFHGSLPRKQALARMNQADIFVQPSHFEGHSLALLEAASMGLPLLVSDVPPQIAAIMMPSGDLAGIAVPLYNPTALSAEISELLNSPQAYRHWSRLSSMLAEQCSGEAMVMRYQRLLGPSFK